jgi:nucleoside-diphosphate-sugar epimerase
VRGETFVTRKITRALARIALGLQDCLYLGNLTRCATGAMPRLRRDAVADAAADAAEDFVIATGVQYSVRDSSSSRPRGWDHCASRRARGDRRRRRSRRVTARPRAASRRRDRASRPRYFRPTEVETLLGDPTKAREKLGWTPATSLPNSCAEMVPSDSRAAARDAWSRGRLPGLRSRVSDEATAIASRESTSPAIAAWSARRSCAAAGGRLHAIVTAPRARARPAIREHARVPRNATPRIFHRRGEGRRHPANNTLPAEFLYQNLMIEANLIHGAHAAGVQRLMFLGSSCIYPRDARSRSRGRLLTGRWSRPTSRTRSPRSPASSCARPTTRSTAGSTSA